MFDLSAKSLSSSRVFLGAGRVSKIRPNIPTWVWTCSHTLQLWQESWVCFALDNLTALPFKRWWILTCRVQMCASVVESIQHTIHPWHRSVSELLSAGTVTQHMMSWRPLVACRELQLLLPSHCSKLLTKCKLIHGSQWTVHISFLLSFFLRPKCDVCSIYIYVCIIFYILCNIMYV